MRSTMNLDADLITILQIVLLAGVPLAFTWSIQRGGLRRWQIDALAVRLGAQATLGPASTSRSPRPSVTRPSGDLRGGRRGRPVDGAGRPFDIENPGPRRRAAAVHRPAAGGVDRLRRHPIADPGYVESAGSRASPERERLTPGSRCAARAGTVPRPSSRPVTTSAGGSRRTSTTGCSPQLVLLALPGGSADRGRRSLPEVVRRATQLRRELDTAAAELRRLVHGLMPALLVERGLYAATEDLVALTPLPTDLMLEGSDAGLPDTVKSAAYFVVAEGLANALKHSGAGRMSVGLNRFNGTLRIEISDNGSAAPSPWGAGLRGLADRIDGLGGRLLIDSPPAQGTRLMAEVPCAR